MTSIECRRSEAGCVAYTPSPTAALAPPGDAPCSAGRRVRPRALLAACLGLIVCSVVPSAAQTPQPGSDDAIVSRGAGVVTTFSGIKTSPDAIAGGHPLDQMLIDPSGNVLRVLDLTNLGGAPSGQLADAVTKLEIKASEIGQVFGVTLVTPEPGAAPDIYAAATSLFGLHIVSTNKSGRTLRLVRGASDASWATGQFGLDNGGGPGTVWKIDGTTGAATPFATILSGTRDNAGPGLGGIAHDPVSRQLFVSSLETGLVHRLDLLGRELGTFDHGLDGRRVMLLPQVADEPGRRMSIHDPAFNSEDPATWGLADKRRRVTALAVEGTRLYYAVAEGPSVWSVGLRADGSVADDARLEIDVAGTPENAPITGLAFDGPARLYLTQRGESVGSYDYATLARPRTSVVYRYAWNDGADSWDATPEEYAVGMPSPHRATNGGVALSYGYDSAGRAEFGRCRATLWTTGESLRATRRDELADGLQATSTENARPASAARARSGSEALQGDFGLYDSDLAPPAESWFVDSGSRGAGRHGQVGALAIHAPCEDAIADAGPDARPPVPADPPAPTPGVHIAKVCHPAPLGGVVACTITLTNVGTSLTGPVGFSDASTVLAGPDKGAVVLIKSAAPDGADWICSPTPTSSLACQLPASGLSAGMSRSVDVLVDTGALVAAGNTGFRNCASLALPWSGKACVESETQIVVKKTAPASCLPGAACTFGLTVTNAGSHGFAGDVLISDSLFQDGGVAPVAAPITAIVPPLGCGPDPVALPFSCTAPMTLAAGQSKTFDITVTMPPAPANYWGHNCFSVSAAGLPAPALPPGPGADEKATSCAWVPVGAPAPLANLRIGKSPLTCHKQGPDTVRCHYEISLENTGPSTSTSPITFDETVPANSSLASIGAPWSCAGGPPTYACSTPAAFDIAPGDGISVPVAIDLERDPLEAQKCWAPNKVAITLPAGGAADNFDAGDDTATATADAAWIRFDEGGPLELVLCDPTNLRTEKVADGPCVEEGEGYRCGYTVTVTNTGPDPFSGRIDVTDTFSTPPVAVAFPAEWLCGGAGANWTCSRGPLDLAKGDSLSMKVSAKFAKAGQCVVSNTATMIFPPANTRWNESGADDSATAFSAIPSPECSRAPTCTAPKEGEIKSASGACVCEDGLARDRSGRCVAPDPEPEKETETEPQPERPVVTPVCEPGRNEYRTASGQCVCKRGFARRDGRCVADDPVEPLCKPGPNEHRTSSNRCVCDEGYVRDRKGRCVPAVKLCTPGPNEHRTPANICVCDAGYARNRDGRCVPDKPDVCPPGMTGKPPKCPPKVCDEGYTGKWPDCRPMICPPGTTGRPPKCRPVTQPTCPPGTKGIPPKCVATEPPRCPPGTVGKPPKCKPAEQPKCPPGTRGTPPKCVAIETPKCPPGTVGKPPRCAKIVLPCPKGQVRKNGQCVPKPDPVPRKPDKAPEVR